MVPALELKIYTYAIFGVVVFLSELIAVTDEQLSSPHIESPAKHQVRVVVVAIVDGTSLHKIHIYMQQDTIDRSAFSFEVRL